MGGALACNLRSPTLRPFCASAFGSLNTKASKPFYIRKRTLITNSGTQNLSNYVPSGLGSDQDDNGCAMNSRPSTTLAPDQQPARSSSVSSRLSFAVSTAERGETRDRSGITAENQIAEEIAEIKRYEVISRYFLPLRTPLHPHRIYSFVANSWSFS